MSTNKKTGDILCSSMPFASQEAYKRLRTNVMFSYLDDGKCKVIGVSSPDVGSGKSTVAINLAYSLAEDGKKVLLIDGDMRKPTIHEKLSLSQTPGLSNLISGINPGKVAQTFEENDVKFSVISAGEIPPNPSELLHSSKMEAILTKLRGMMEYIIIDLSPVFAVSDAQVISKDTDGMLIVVRSGHCDADMLAGTLKQFELANAKVLGFVLNGVELTKSKKYYGTYGSYEKYGYYKK